MQAEREALKAAAEEAETKVSAAQVARDRATKEVSRLLSSTGGGMKVMTVSGSMEERVAL